MADTTDPVKVLEHIKTMSIEPFQGMLAHFMECQPDQHSIREFAKKYPDRYVQALVMASKLAGYRSDAPIVQNNLFMVIQGMSDSELRQLNQELEVKRKELMERTVEGDIDGT